MAHLRIDSSLPTQFSKVEDGRTDAFPLSSASHVVNGARDPTAFFLGPFLPPKNLSFQWLSFEAGGGGGAEVFISAPR